MGMANAGGTPISRKGPAAVETFYDHTAVEDKLMVPDENVAQPLNANCGSLSK